MRILALDPGDTVGWLASHIHKGALRIDDYGNTRFKAAALGLENPAHVLYVPRYDVVIFETWILTTTGARTSIGSEMESSQFIGCIRSACWRNAGETKIVRSAPKRKTDATMYLRNDYWAGHELATLIDAAPARHDDSHYADAALHTVAYFHKEFV